MYTQRNYPMANNSGLTLGMRQTVCLSAGDISFRNGPDKVPVIARGHVRLKSDYGITGNGHGTVFVHEDSDIDTNNPCVYDAKVDIYMTEFSRAYLELGETQIRRFIK